MTILKPYIPPKPTYVLHMTSTFSMELCGKIPNKWNQFWMKFLLGWTMEPIKK